MVVVVVVQRAACWCTPALPPTLHVHPTHTCTPSHPCTHTLHTPRHRSVCHQAFMAHQQEEEATVLPRVASTVSPSQLAGMAGRWVAAKQRAPPVALAALRGEALPTAHHYQQQQQQGGVPSVGHAPPLPRIAVCTFAEPPVGAAAAGGAPQEEWGEEPKLFGGV